MDGVEGIGIVRRRVGVASLVVDVKRGAAERCVGQQEVEKVIVFVAFPAGEVVVDATVEASGAFSRN